MPAGPRATPFPVVVQFSDSTNPLIPVKLLESSSLLVPSLSAVTVSATTYLNLPTLGGEVTSIYQLASTGILELTSYSRSNFATTGQLQSYVLTSTNNNLSSLVASIQTSTVGLSSTLESHLTSAVHWTRSQLDFDYLNSSGDTADAGFYLSSVSAVNLSATNYYNLPSTTLVWKEAQDIVLYVHNKTTATISKGTPVTIVSGTGGAGEFPSVEPLSSVNNHVPEAYGLSNHVAGLAQETILADGVGHIIVEGILEGEGAGDPLDTSMFEVGDMLYVSSNGQLSNQRPTPPYEMHPVGIVLRKQHINGKIVVKIENAPELNDIVGFNLSQSILDGDIIAYDLTTSTFKNVQALNISGASKFGSVSATTYLNLPNFATTATNVTAFAGTGVFETTSYASNTYATTASLAGYETTAYARNNYLVTSVNVTALNGTGIFETTGYARNTYATTASLAVYETTGYARNNYVLTSTNNALSASYAAHLASATVHFTAASLTSTYETTGYARNNYATTAQLGAYETTAYARNNYVLTSTNSNLSSTVSNHLASAVHWDLNTLNSYYLNASGDSVTGAFIFGSVTATTISATNFSGASLSGSLRDVAITTTPTTGYVLKWNGSRWAPAADDSGTGGASEPGGAEGDVQYNSVGGFGGAAVFNYNEAAQKLIVPNFSATNISATTYFNLPSVTALNGTSVFETTGYARNTYATTAQLSNYALTASLAAYETTAYARNNYVLTSTNSALSSSYNNHLASSIVHFTAASLTSTYETTGYARNTYATTAQLAGYETTAYARNNYLLTSVNVTALNGTGVFETTGYARNTYATTASLAAYETTGYARNNYVLTSTNSALSSSYNAHLASSLVHFTAASLTSTYETTGYARNTYATTAQLGSYVLTSVNDGLSSSYNNHLASSIVHFTAASLTSTYETTGYARNTYATTAQLGSYALTASLGAYETTGYARNNYVLTSTNSALSSSYDNHLASASVHFTAASLTSIYETTGYARNTYATTAAYATTASLATYETTSYARNNYVLTSVNSNLSSTVSNHLASAVHWQLSTLNNNYVNASGDSVTGSYYFRNLSSLAFSSNIVSATKVYPASAARRNWVYFGDPVDGSLTQASGGNLWFSGNARLAGFPIPSATLFTQRIALAAGDTKTGIFFGGFSANAGLAPEDDLREYDPPIFIPANLGTNDLAFIDSSGQLSYTTNITITTDQAQDDKLNAGTVSAEFIYVNDIIYANNISATTYQNLPSFATTATNVTSFAGTGVFETTAYARTNYSLTSHNHSFSALSGLSDVQVTSTPTTNYVLKWNGSKWAPAVDDTGGGELPNAFALIEDESANTVAAVGEDTVKFVSRNNGITITTDNSQTPQEVVFEVAEAGVIHNNLFGLTTGNPHTQYATLSGAIFTGQVKAPSISATDYYNLPSGTALWNASQLEGVTVTSTAPTTGQALVYNGSEWQPSSLPTGGAGSTSPGGLDKSVQFNNNGSFSGTSDFNYTASSQRLSVPTISATTYENLPKDWTLVLKTANQTTISNTTLVDDTHLNFTMEANQVYSIRLEAYFNTNATADFKYGFRGTQAATDVHLRRDAIVGGGTGYTTIGISTAYNTAGTALAGTGTDGYVSLAGFIENGANPSTFYFTWAQNTSNATNTTVFKGSYLEYCKV